MQLLEPNMTMMWSALLASWMPRAIFGVAREQCIVRTVPRFRCVVVPDLSLFGYGASTPLLIDIEIAPCPSSTQPQYQVAQALRIRGRNFGNCKQDQTRRPAGSSKQKQQTRRQTASCHEAIFAATLPCHLLLGLTSCKTP